MTYRTCSLTWLTWTRILATTIANVQVNDIYNSQCVGHHCFMMLPPTSQSVIHTSFELVGFPLTHAHKKYAPVVCIIYNCNDIKQIITSSNSSNNLLQERPILLCSCLHGLCVCVRARVRVLCVCVHSYVCCVCVCTHMYVVSAHVSHTH